MQTEYDYLFKILLIGASNVGKSSIMSRYVDNIFNESYISTIGVDFKIKTLEINNKIIKLQIWDTAGQERFKSITSSYYRGSSCIIVVFDLSDNNSFTDTMNIWLEEIKKNNEKNGSTPLIYIVGNKSDKKINVNNIDMMKYKLEKLELGEINYLEVSAKNNTNIEYLFETLSEKLMKKHHILLEEKNNIIIGSNLVSTQLIDNTYCNC